MRVNLKRPGFRDTRRLVFIHLVNQLIEDYDLDQYQAKDWIKTPEGLNIFVKYLTELGYRVKTYAWPSEKDPYSAGLEFDDDDPLIVALKLKYHKDD